MNNDPIPVLEEQRPEHAYPQIYTGQIIDLNGAKFRVNTCTSKSMNLQCMPGTTIQEPKMEKIKKEIANLRLVAQEAFVERQKLLAIVTEMLKITGGGLMIPGADRTMLLDFVGATTLDPKERLEITPRKNIGKLEVKLVREVEVKSE